jgi:hypothetical protein
VGPHAIHSTRHTYLASSMQRDLLSCIPVLTRNSLHNGLVLGSLQSTMPETGFPSTLIIRTHACATSQRGPSSPTSLPALDLVFSMPLPTMTMAGCGSLARLPIGVTATAVRAMVPRAQAARPAPASSHGGRASPFPRASTPPLRSPRARRTCLTLTTR